MASRERAFPERLLLQAGARRRLVPRQAIDSLLASDNYVEVHCGRERYLVRETLAEIEARLDPGKFVRIHRSRVVRVDAVQDVELLPSGQYLLRMLHVRDASVRRFHKATKCGECRHIQRRALLAPNHAAGRQDGSAGNRRARSNEVSSMHFSACAVNGVVG